jgi:hypothetical protein
MYEWSRRKGMLCCEVGGRKIILACSRELHLDVRQVGDVEEVAAMMIQVSLFNSKSNHMTFVPKKGCGM